MKELWWDVEQPCHWQVMVHHQDHQMYLAC